MKKFTFFAVLTALCLSVFTPAFAAVMYEATKDGVKYEYSSDLGFARVLGLADDAKNQSSIVIPDKFIGYPVEEIKQAAFSGATNLKKVDLSSATNLKVISTMAFANTPLEELILPSSVKQGLAIQPKAFYLTKIKKLDITCEVNLINAPFEQCGLEEVNFLHYCVVQADAFFNCSNLRTLNFSANVYLYNNAFNAVAMGSKFDINISEVLPLIDESATQLCNPGNLGKVRVACDLMDAYKADAKWMAVSANPTGMLYVFASLAEALPEIKVQNGSLKILSEPTSCEKNTYTLFAVAAEGFEFKQWADGTTENPRTVEPVCAVCSYDADMLTPQFEAKANGIEEIISENGTSDKARKFMHNGQIVIVMPDGRAINALGQEVK